MVLEPKHVLQKVLGAVWRAGTIVPTKVPCTNPHTRHSNKHTLATDTISMPENIIGKQELPEGPRHKDNTMGARAGKPQAL